MRHGTIAIAICFFLMPIGEAYGYNKVKTADDYLDEAELIIKDVNYMPLLENKKGERQSFGEGRGGKIRICNIINKKYFKQGN